MGGKQTPAVLAAQRAGIHITVHDLGDEGVPDDDRGYGVVAAEAMGVDPARVFKTILVTSGRLAVAVVPVTTTVDLKAVAKALGVKKVEVAAAADAERATGYVVGGISPLGQRTRLQTVVDRSAMGHPAVYVSGGRRGLEIEVAPSDLVAATSAILAEIARS